MRLVFKNLAGLFSPSTGRFDIELEDCECALLSCGITDRLGQCAKTTTAAALVSCRRRFSSTVKEAKLETDLVERKRNTNFSF